jgi:hypothetical protein
MSSIIRQNHAGFSIIVRNLFISSFSVREHCLVPYCLTEPPWFRIFRHRTFCSLALSNRTMQGSLLSCGTFLVHHFWRENIVWFSIVRQNLLDSRFLGTEPFLSLALSDRTMQDSVLPGRTL